MKRLLTFWSLALLSGCGTDGQTHVEYRTVEVTKEVARACPVTVPDRPAPIGTLPTDLEPLVAALGAKLKEYSAPGGYADKAEAAILTCKSAGQ